MEAMIHIGTNGDPAWCERAERDIEKVILTDLADGKKGGRKEKTGRKFKILNSCYRCLWSSFKCLLCGILLSFDKQSKM